MRLSRIPFWMLCTGLTFFACWLPLALLGSVRIVADVTNVAREFAPVFLGLGIAFTVYGVGYHVALNLVYWREIREDDREGQAALCGRKRFERRKKKNTLPPAKWRERTKEEDEEGCFDELD